MIIRSPYFPAIALLAGLALACQKPASPNKAPTGQAAAPVAGTSTAADPVQEAVVKYLTEVRGLDLSKMNVSFGSPKVDGDKATCEASFKVKGMDDMPPMEYTYQLQKEGGAWKVLGSAGKDGGHAGAPSSGAGMPAGHPGMEGGAAGQGGGSMGMPAGHPDVSDMKPAQPADAQPKSK